MHSLGRRILELDGFHRTFAWLHRDNDQVAMLVLDPEDQEDKVVKIRRLAQEVERTGADTVLFTTESWFAPEVDVEDPRATLRASQREDRREGLATYLLRREGDHAAWMTLFGRDEDGGVVLGDTDEQRDFPPIPLFAPVLRVWEAWQTQRS
jgi:hypothetical protein